MTAFNRLPAPMGLLVDREASPSKPAASLPRPSLLRRLRRTRLRMPPKGAKAKKGGTARTG